jgi:hypothetical protein
MDIMTIICISVFVVVFIIIPLVVQIGDDKPTNNNTQLDDYPTSDEQIDETVQSSSIPTAEQSRKNSNNTIDDYTWYCALNDIRKKIRNKTYTGKCSCTYRTKNHALANKLAEYFREMGYDVNIYTLERSGGYMYNGFMSFYNRTSQSVELEISW